MKKVLAAWTLYDFGSSAFAAIIQTFLFAPFFIQQIAQTPLEGSIIWGYANGGAGVAVAILSPLLGAIADKTGKRRLWLLTFTLLCVGAIFFLGTLPTSAPLSFWIFLIIAATIGGECAFVFYNAYLPDLAPQGAIGKWSGWGWALGYLGGLCSLLVAWQAARWGIRASFLVAGAWYMIFAFPFLLLAPVIPSKTSLADGAKQGIKELGKTVLEVGKYRHIALFLLAHLLYIDGLTTLFVFGGAYANALFGIEGGGLFLFGILLHVTAGLGSLIFSFADDLLGPKRLILLCLGFLICLTSVLLISYSQVTFWITGAFLGIFVGPVQAASRSWLGKAAPAKMRGEFFGLFAFSGKATAFIGPLAVGYVADATGSLRAALSVIVFLFLVGAALMTAVDAKPGIR